MTHVKTNQIKQAYRNYSNSTATSIFDIYEKPSHNKAKVLNRCHCLCLGLGGDCSSVKIISHNAHTFSVGFLFNIGEKSAFAYITKDYDRYIFTSEL